MSPGIHRVTHRRRQCRPVGSGRRAEVASAGDGAFGGAFGLTGTT